MSNTVKTVDDYMIGAEMPERVTSAVDEYSMSNGGMPSDKLSMIDNLYLNVLREVGSDPLSIMDRVSAVHVICLYKAEDMMSLYANLYPNSGGFTHKLNTVTFYKHCLRTALFCRENSIAPEECRGRLAVMRKSLGLDQSFPVGE